MVHELKILPSHFAAVESGDKQFEIRENSDRGFQKGDRVLLREYDPHLDNALDDGHTGSVISVLILYVSGYNQPQNQVVFGFKRL